MKKYNFMEAKEFMEENRKTMFLVNADDKIVEVYFDKLSQYIRNYETEECIVFEYGQQIVFCGIFMENVPYKINDYVLLYDAINYSYSVVQISAISFEKEMFTFVNKNNESVQAHCINLRPFSHLLNKTFMLK